MLCVVLYLNLHLKQNKGAISCYCCASIVAEVVELSPLTLIHFLRDSLLLFTKHVLILSYPSLCVRALCAVCVCVRVCVLAGLRA